MEKKIDIYIFEIKEEIIIEIVKFFQRKRLLVIEEWVDQEVSV